MDDVRLTGNSFTIFILRISQVECANGQQGYGRRRRRDVPGDSGDAPDRNKIYEVSMSTLVKVAEEPVEGKPSVWVEKGKEKKRKKIIMKLIFSSLATLREIYHPDEAALAALSEEFGAYKYIDFQGSEEGGSSNGSSSRGLASATLLLTGISIAILGRLIGA